MWKVKGMKAKMKEEKVKNKKKIDKMGVATKIIAGLMVFFMIGGVVASFVYYLLRVFK